MDAKLKDAEEELEGREVVLWSCRWWVLVLLGRSEDVALSCIKGTPLDFNQTSRSVIVATWTARHRTYRSDRLRSRCDLRRRSRQESSRRYRNSRSNDRPGISEKTGRDEAISLSGAIDRWGIGVESGEESSSVGRGRGG